MKTSSGFSVCVAVLSLASFACSASVSPDAPETSGSDDTATKELVASKSNSPSAQVNEDLPAAPADEETPSTPVTTPGASKRDCGLRGTAPTTLTTRALWLTSIPFKFGAGVVNGKPIATQWASGTPTKVAGTSGLVQTFTAGHDSDLLTPLAAWGGPGSTLFIDATGFAGTAWAKKYAPSTTRLTYSIRDEATTVSFSIAAPKKTSSTPTDKDALFVRGAAARALFAATLVFDFPNTCAVDAVSDLLGRRAFVANALDLPGGMLGSDMTDEIQQSLIENKVSVTIAVIGTTKVAGVVAALNASTCSTGNLTACKETLRAVGDAYSAARTARGTAIEAATIASGTDPIFTSATFSTGDVGIL